ncbi:MAG: glycosyltransferase family 2 protein [Oscillospiraceae bacterium]|nr:glycosyltransferase family 2 protein [Oscillospiraceae bacterium]
MLISYVIPCYRSEQTIGGVVADIKKTITENTDYGYEIILVNDCSPDGVYSVLQQLAAEDGNVKVINLAKNFGQHSALMAGLNRAKGDVVVCLDDDGQTPPSESLKLIDALGENVDVVYASYDLDGKKHSGFRNFGSMTNDLMLQKLLGKSKDLKVTSFFAAKKYIIKEMCRYHHAFPYLMGLVLRSTNKIINVPVHHKERLVGRSGYTLKSLLKLWINGFTAFSVLPLRISTFGGVVLAILGFLYGIYTVINRFINPLAPMGYASIMSALLFIGGMIMLMLGMLGEYIGRIYLSINNAPQFVERNTINFDDSEN